MAKRIQDNPDHWSDIMGLPDEWDVQNLQALIGKFKKRKFSIEGKVITGATYIRMCVAEARHSHGMDNAFTASANPYNEKIKNSEMRAMTTLPPELNKEILEAYPAMFRDKKYSYWFAKHFPEFKIANKI